MQRWLSDKIEATRRACTETVCALCGVDVLVGPSADFAYWTATVDPVDIDAFSEAVAYLSGRFAYQLHRNELHIRDRWQFEHVPRPYVVLDHQCEVST